MARSDGFDVMDVRTDIVNDPKFRRIQRLNHDHVLPAIAVYLALLGDSWKAGRRVSIVDAWPGLAPYDAAVAASMVEAGLLDRKGQIPAKAWAGWFGVARERRESVRARWRRANDRRKGGPSEPSDPRTDDTVEPSGPPRGSSGDSGASPYRSVPSVPYRSDPSAPSDARATNGEADPYDEVVAWLAGRKAWVDSPKIGTDLARMVDRKGAAAVIAAMAAVPDAEMAAQFVYGAQHALFPLAGSRTTPKGDDPDPEYVQQQLAERRRARQAARSGNA